MTIWNVTTIVDGVKSTFQIGSGKSSVKAILVKKYGERMTEIKFTKVA